jgi:hypothetical protein
MKAADAEVLEVSRKLSPKKRREWITLGREWSATKARAQKPAPAKIDHDAEWERILNDPKPRPKLRAYVDRILREEKAEPMDMAKL